MNVQKWCGRKGEAKSAQTMCLQGGEKAQLHSAVDSKSHWRGLLRVVEGVSLLLKLVVMVCKLCKWSSSHGCGD